MHSVQADGKGVIARIRDFLNNAGVEHTYKARVFTFAGSEELLESVLAIGKENDDWAVFSIVALAAPGSEFVTGNEGGLGYTDDVPVFRMTPEQHAAEQVLTPPVELTADEEQARQLAEMASPPPPPIAPTPVAPAAPVEIVLPEAPTDAEQAAEQARQLAEMAAMSAQPPRIDAPPPVQPFRYDSEVEIVLPEALDGDAQAAEQARQLAEMASSLPAGGSTFATATSVARTAQTSGGVKVARTFTLMPGFVVPSVHGADEPVSAHDTAQSIYYRRNRLAQLRDRVHHVEILLDGQLLDRFPVD